MGKREEQIAARIAKQIDDDFAKSITFGGRVADRVAEVGGSWSFVIGFGLALVLWIAINSLIEAFDPYPYIFLNLILSCLAAIQAPIIMMSQNRLSARDRLKMDQDYLVDVEAELQIERMNKRVEAILETVGQIEEKVDRLVPRE